MCAGVKKCMPRRNPLLQRTCQVRHYNSTLIIEALNEGAYSLQGSTLSCYFSYTHTHIHTASIPRNANAVEDEVDIE